MYLDVQNAAAKYSSTYIPQARRLPFDVRLDGAVCITGVGTVRVRCSPCTRHIPRAMEGIATISSPEANVDTATPAPPPPPPPTRTKKPKNNQKQGQTPSSSGNHLVHGVTGGSEEAELAEEEPRALVTPGALLLEGGVDVAVGVDNAAGEPERGERGAGDREREPADRGRDQQRRQILEVVLVRALRAVEPVLGHVRRRLLRRCVRGRVRDARAPPLAPDQEAVVLVGDARQDQHAEDVAATVLAGRGRGGGEREANPYSLGTRRAAILRIGWSGSVRVVAIEDGGRSQVSGEG